MTQGAVAHTGPGINAQAAATGAILGAGAAGAYAASGGSSRSKGIN